MDQLASYDTAAVMDISNNARFALDKKLYVQFRVEPILNRSKSAEAGRAIFDAIDYIKIFVPGDKNTVIDTPVTPEYQIRFKEKYEAFKAGKEMAPSGTPLEMWPQMTVTQVAELKAMNVSTVEQLADMPDQLAQKIMGSHSLRQKAKAFLEASLSDAANTKLQAELEKRDNEIQLLKSQMQQIMAAQAAPKSKG